MQTIINTYLRFTSLRKTVFWDFYSLNNKNSIQSRYPIVSLKEVLTQRKESILIDDSLLYKRCRVQVQAKGVVLRDEVIGKEIKTKKQQLCKKDDFLVAEIDAKVGGYGIVPQELENAIVSGHYFLFEIDQSKLLPEFLGIVVKQNDFAKQIKSTGSTNYAAIRPYHVLEYLIPLPTIADQKRIVKSYQEKIDEAERLETEAKGLEGEIELFLFEKLGIVISMESTERTLFNLVKFSNTQRWDTLFLLGRLPSSIAKYELKQFSDIIINFNRDGFGKSCRIDTKNFPANEFRYIGMEHVEKETGNVLEMPIVKGHEIKSQTLIIPKEFLIFGKLRPYLNKYWINNTEFDNIICSSEFFVFDIDSNVDKLYFKYILASNFIQSQITDKTSGARMPRINEEIFFNLEIPIPPINIQIEIANTISSMKAKIESYKLKAKDNKQLALVEFEKEIFG